MLTRNDRFELEVLRKHASGMANLVTRLLKRVEPPSESQTSHTMYTSVGGSPPQRPTPTKCVANGGHCWEGDPVSLQQRICKHCGLRQRGVRQELVAWEDVTP